MFPNTASLALLVLCVPLVLSVLSCRAEAPAGDPRAVAARLVILLEDPSEDVRRTAALSLGKIGLAVAAPAVARALADPDPVVREYSAWALGRMGEAVSDKTAVRLVETLSDTHHAVRKAAARALGHVGPRQPVLALVTEALTTGSRERRRAVVETLTQLEAPGAYPGLVRALTDADPVVRQGALAALGELADRRALADFRGRLLRDADAGVRAEAAYRIGKLGGTGDVPALKRAAARDTARAVREWAAWAVAAIVEE